MFITNTAIVALLGFAFPTIAFENPDACKQNACLRKVVQGEETGGRGACEAFFGTTVVPQSFSTAITTRFKTFFTIEVATETVQTTVSYTNTLTTTSTETDTEGVTTSSLPPSPTGQQQQKLVRRSQSPSAITYSSTTVPAYATKECQNTAVYSSACSCVGVTHYRTTLPPHVKTQTVTQHRTVIQTITRTTTDINSISTAVSVATATTTTTSTVASVVVGGQCTQVSSSYNTYMTYDNYYSGQGYEESQNNPGNDQASRPPQTTDFTDLGPNDACAAIEACADFAVQLSPTYFSFDIHYLSSSATWECIAYFDQNNDPSYFSVANPDITQGYGFTYNP